MAHLDKIDLKDRYISNVSFLHPSKNMMIDFAFNQNLTEIKVGDRIKTLIPNAHISKFSEIETVDKETYTLTTETGEKYTLVTISKEGLVGLNSLTNPLILSVNQIDNLPYLEVNKN